jgi:hypothetical protein
LYKDILFDNYLLGNSNEEFIEKIRALKESKELYNQYSSKSQNISIFYSKENVLDIWRNFYTEIFSNKKVNHLVFLNKESKGLNKIMNGDKTMLVRGSSTRKNIFSKVRKGDTLYFVDKNGKGYIQCKAIVKDIINTDELDEETALALILEHQKELMLTASQIKKWSTKPYLTLVTIEQIENIEPFKVEECSYINMDDWITIDRELED